jgi:uncharacterized protein (DUF2235 family)
MKNIVLLSDGTGNSSAKFVKTNVWRMYEALDLTGGDQVALYDNGVGTSGFMPLALLGGAFGWGLKRNVQHLYAFLCRSYEPGDRIYAFGFSRGAFTVRVLVGLIANQGVIAGRDGADLTRLVAWAYRGYRRRYNQTGVMVRWLRAIRDTFFRSWEDLRRRDRYDEVKKEHPPVEFVGVWDTVDAYGLPIDELTRGWDDWVWPLTLPTRTPSDVILKACHALALDDERHTFHPVLWDESREPTNATSTHLDDERISQVWFAGMHSNVGGGYPDDGLAHVSLCWMATEATKRHLKFQPHLCRPDTAIPEGWLAKADSGAPIHDSRRGLAGYYRYNPRHIGRLAHDKFDGVSIVRPKIHESVFERIRRAPDAYAPIVLPDRYAVVARDGTVMGGVSHPVEDATQSVSRSHDQERAWNLVWKRRIVYFATVFASVVLMTLPFGTAGGRLGLFDDAAPSLGMVVRALGALLPALASPWIDYFAEFPLQLLVGVTVVTLLMLTSSRLRQRINDTMSEVWQPIASAGPTAVEPSPTPTDWIFRLRTHPIYRACFLFLTRQCLPFVFGVVMLFALVMGGILMGNRIAFGTAMLSGLVCRDVTPRASKAGQWELDFSSRTFCHATGIVLEGGTRYSIDVILPAELPDDPPEGTYVPGRDRGRWMDRQYPVTDLSGWTGNRAFAFTWAWPLKRILRANWFTIILRVGSTAGEYHVVDKTGFQFTPRKSGQLFLFVNDAVVPLPGWTSVYENNTGGPARVTVREVKSALGGAR